jgi:ribose transport system permease protein
MSAFRTETPERSDAAESSEASAASPAPDRRRRRGFRLGGEGWITLALFVLAIALIIGSRAISPAFGGWAQTKAILTLAVFVIVVGYGQGLVILVGGLDLSVASAMTVGGILAFRWIGPDAGALIWGLPLILLVGSLIGAANGVGVTMLKVPPFIMTLAAGIIVYSGCLGFTQGTPRGQASPALSSLFTNEVAGVPLILLVMLALVLLAALAQSTTPFGRRLYAVGASPEAAWIAGLPVRALIISAYAISGACACLAGVLMVGYASGASLTMGQDYLLPSIAAVVIGGSSILGGRGNYLGTVGGALLLTTLSTIIAALGIAQGWRTVIYGIVILVALVLLREQFYAWVDRALRGRS